MGLCDLDILPFVLKIVKFRSFYFCAAQYEIYLLDILGVYNENLGFSEIGWEWHDVALTRASSKTTYNLWQLTHPFFQHALLSSTLKFA